MENQKENEKINVPPTAPEGAPQVAEVAKPEPTAVVEIPEEKSASLLTAAEKQMLIDQIITGKSQTEKTAFAPSSNAGTTPARDVTTAPLVLSILSIIFVGLCYMGVPLIQWVGLILACIALTLVKRVPQGGMRVAILVMSIVSVVLCAISAIAGLFMLLVYSSLAF